MIAVAGKEWVTSDADKWGIAAEVVEMMQNALAVLQLPLATAPSAMPDVVPASQDFAASFAAELPGLEGDVAPVDPALIAVDPSGVWVAPIISVPGLLSVGLQGTEPATATPEDLAVPVESAVPGVEKLPASAPASPTFAEEDVSNADQFAADKSKATLEPDRAAEGSVAAARPEPRPMNGLVEGPSPDIMRAEQTARRIPGLTAAEELADSGLVGRPAPAEGIAKEVGKVASAAVDAGAPLDDPQTSAPLPMIPHAEKRQDDPSPVSRFAKATLPALTDAATGEAVPLALTEVETGPPQGPDGPKPAGRPIVDTAVVPALAADPLSPPPFPSADTPVITSFWERFFTGGSDIRSKSVFSQDRMVQVPADRIASTTGLATQLVLGADDPTDAGVSTDDVSDSIEEDGFEVTFTAPSTAAASGASATPVARSEPVPILAVLPWSDEASDQAGGVESALSGLPVLSSSSMSAATTAPGGPLTLPVQQVAVQMAGVLVQASDRATELALAPEELGKVRLRIETDVANPDRLTITINVERPETLDLFRRHAGELAEAIRNSGYGGAHIDFGSHSQGSDGDQPQGRSAAGPDLPTEEIAPTQHSPRRIAGATLDLRL